MASVCGEGGGGWGEGACWARVILSSIVDILAHNVSRKACTLHDIVNLIIYCYAHEYCQNGLINENLILRIRRLKTDTLK